jgi:hypothetical protein
MNKVLLSNGLCTIFGFRDGVDWLSVTDVSGGSSSRIKTIIFMLQILLSKRVRGLLDPRWDPGCPERSVLTSLRFVTDSP